MLIQDPALNGFLKKRSKPLKQLLIFLIQKLADLSNPELHLKEYRTLTLLNPVTSLFLMQVLKLFLPQHLLLQKLPVLLAADAKHVVCLD